MLFARADWLTRIWVYKYIHLRASSDARNSKNRSFPSVCFHRWIRFGAIYSTCVVYTKTIRWWIFASPLCGHRYLPPSQWIIVKYIYRYITSSVMHAFWLVLTYDLLEDRRIDDDRARFKFDSCVILWTNPNSLLSIATNQLASFCIDNRLRQGAIFVSVKVAKFEIKRLFSVYFSSLLSKTNRFYVAVRLFSNRSQCHFFVLFIRHLWSITEQTQYGIYLSST